MHDHLPSAWLDRVFGRLALRYADQWLRMWDGLDMAAVRADWAEQLAGLQNRPEAIRFALDHLPTDWPPNVAQFKALCNRAPDHPAPAALPAPKFEPNLQASAAVRALAHGVAKPLTLRSDKPMTIAQREVLKAIQRAQELRRLPTVVKPMREPLWAPQGPLPWPNGVQRPDSHEGAP